MRRPLFAGLCLFLLAMLCVRVSAQEFSEGKQLFDSYRYEEAFSIFKRAADLGDMEASFYMAYMLATGVGTNVDLPYATRLYRTISDLEKVRNSPDFERMAVVMEDRLKATPDVETTVVAKQLEYASGSPKAPTLQANEALNGSAAGANAAGTSGASFSSQENPIQKYTCQTQAEHVWQSLCSGCPAKGERRIEQARPMKVTLDLTSDEIQWGATRLSMTSSGDRYTANRCEGSKCASISLSLNPPRVEVVENDPARWNSTWKGACQLVEASSGLAHASPKPICPTNLAYLESKIPTFRDPTLSDVRGKLISSPVPSGDVGQLRQQAKQYDDLARQAMTCVQATSIVEASDDSLMGLIEQFKAIDCDQLSVQQSCLCSVIAYKLGAFGMRQMASQALQCN